MRREGTSAPEFPSSPFRRPSPPFPKLSKYASGTPDRWTLISLAIWPQFVFLANEADYWAGWLMALKSTGFAPAVRGHLNFCREIRLITGIEIAPDATHSVHKCTNIITDNACRCFQSASNSFDSTDWGVARRATTVQLQFSVLGDPELSAVVTGSRTATSSDTAKTATGPSYWSCLCVRYPNTTTYVLLSELRWLIY